ncbi:hypothetical protein HJ590_06900 [Naumannella sp. ID2617S]|nr:hypothetical protein [Naumannella sp. ID2617S]
MSDQPTNDQTSTGQPTQLTEEDQQRVRNAVMLAGALVSNADPGFLDTFKESFATGKALQAAPPELQRILRGGGLPHLPADRSNLEGHVIELVGEVRRLLETQTPQLVQPYRELVLTVARDVAEAAKGTSSTEQAAIGKLEQALS